MARRSKRKKGARTAAQKAFAKAARKCHAETTSASAYGKCVRAEMKATYKPKAKRARRKKKR